MMPAEFRPVKIKFAGEKLTPEQFDHLARQLKELMDFRVEIGRLLFILLESLFHSWRGLAKEGVLLIESLSSSEKFGDLR